MSDRPINYSTSNPNLKFEFFPESLTALRVEIDNHPALLKILAAQEDKDVYIQISEIAAYCGIILEGEYTRDDVIRLADKLVWELKKKSSILILPSFDGTQPVT